MNPVSITINGCSIQARAGQTVLEAAADAGIDIPALCHHPGLKPEGACRVCLVEIEKQRTLQPACTFPVTEGMVVRTESDAVVTARKFSLQMLFSERSHYCMYCPKSGSDTTTDCQLQKLGYRYGLSSWEFAPDYSKTWPMDASRKYFVMDHSRCILCRRCIRACTEIAANNTLGVHERGARTMIAADYDIPFADSSCVSCGTCLQVCPTGALTDRASVYMGHDSDTTRTKATCMGCSVGCGIEGVARDNHLLRVEGDWQAGNAGLLCATGRFESVAARPKRIQWPLRIKDGVQVETSWDKAFGIIADRFAQTHRVAGLISPRMTNQCMAAFACFFNEVLHSSELALLYGEVPPTGLGRSATMSDVAKSDCIIVIGGDPLERQKVLGYFVKRAVSKDARLIVINDSPTDLDRLAQLHLRLRDISSDSPEGADEQPPTYHLSAESISRLKEAAEEAQRPVILYGADLSATVYAALRALPAKTRFMPLIHGTNAAGAAKLGLTVRPVHGDALFVLVGDDMPENIPGGLQLPIAPFTIVQSAYHNAWTESADIVLPARAWTEKEGDIFNIEGRMLPVTPLSEAPKSVLADWVTLVRLATRIGYSLPFDAIPGISAAR